MRADHIGAINLISKTLRALYITLYFTTVNSYEHSVNNPKKFSDFEDEDRAIRIWAALGNLISEQLLIIIIIIIIIISLFVSTAGRKPLPKISSHAYGVQAASIFPHTFS